MLSSRTFLALLLLALTSSVTVAADPTPIHQHTGIRLDTDDPPPDPANRRLWFLRGGSGPCVVLIHALGGDDSEWAVDGTRLTANHQVLVVDLPGHGKSKAPPLPIHLDDMASQVDGLMREQGCAPAVVVGHSIGGTIAAHLAAMDPGIVRGLVVVDSVLAAFPFAGEKERDAFVADLKRNRRATLDKFYGPIANKSQVKKLVDGAMKVDPQVLVGLLWAASTEPLGPRAAAIRVPTLLMASSLLIDHATPQPAQLAKMGFTMPKVRVEEFPASKHWLLWDEPAHFAKALDAFLAEVER